MNRIITAPHVAATLRVAATIIDLGGWHQGGYMRRWEIPARDAVYPVCVMGAIAQACGLPPTAWHEDPQDTDAALAHSLMKEAVVALGVHVGVFRPDEVPFEEDVPTRLGDGWNDDPVRTADQVIRALRDAADDVEVAA